MTESESDKRRAALQRLRERRGAGGGPRQFLGQGGAGGGVGAAGAGGGVGKLREILRARATGGGVGAGQGVGGAAGRRGGLGSGAGAGAAGGGDRPLLRKLMQQLGGGGAAGGAGLGGGMSGVGATASRDPEKLRQVLEERMEKLQARIAALEAGPAASDDGIEDAETIDIAETAPPPAPSKGKT